MDRIGGGTTMSYSVAAEATMESYMYNDELQRLMISSSSTTTPPESGGGNSFTALLGLPANQAMELLHSSPPPPQAMDAPMATASFQYLNCSAPAFPTNAGLIERAAKYSVFAAAAREEEEEAEAECAVPSNSERIGVRKDVKKEEDAEGCGNPNLMTEKKEKEKGTQKQLKRKEREKKAKGSSKRSRTENSDDGEKLPYVHVRARRGQATDSHSLAERARREKINARMKLLQELVPGCNKISGTALVLDEIINHVQSLQRQVEVLSMRLAAVIPRIDFNLDSLFASGDGSVMDGNFLGMGMPLMWPETQFNGDGQQCQQQWHFESLTHPLWPGEGDRHNLITSENSLLSYGSPANSASLHSSQLKMEL